MARKTGYELTRRWFDFAFEKKEAKCHHTAVFCWLVELNNRLGWKDEFGVPANSTMEGLGIGNRNTYHGVLKDLQDWKFIKIVQESKNQYQSMFITLCLSENDQAPHQALTKHSASIASGTAPIVKQETVKPKKQKKELVISIFNDEANKFCEWYLEKHHPSNIQVTDKIKKGWVDTYRKLREIDNKTKDEIKNATIYGRTNDFWKRQFLSPNKLRSKNKEDIMYIDVFLAQLSVPTADKTLKTERIYDPSGGIYPEATT